MDRTLIGWNVISGNLNGVGPTLALRLKFKLLPPMWISCRFGGPFPSNTPQTPQQSIQLEGRFDFAFLFLELLITSNKKRR